MYSKFKRPKSFKNYSYDMYTKLANTEMFLEGILKSESDNGILIQVRATYMKVM